MRLTFAKMRRNGYSPVMYEAKRGGVVVAYIQRRERGGPSSDTWFWYGMGRNTCGALVTLEEAKAQVRARAAELGADIPPFQG